MRQPSLMLIQASIFAACSLVASPMVGLRAQSPISAYSTHLTDWPAGLGSGAFERLVPADVDGDSITDCVVLRNGSVYMAQNVAYFQAITATVPGANLVDIELAPEIGLVDSLGVAADGFAVVSPSFGLGTVIYDGTNFVATTIVSSANWLSVGKLFLYDQDPTDAKFTVCGLTSSLKKIVTRDYDSGVWTKGTTFNVPLDVKFITQCNWDGGGVDEIVFVSATRLDPYGVSGNALPPYSTTHEVLGATAVDGPGGDHVAAVLHNAVASQKELLLVNGNLLSGQPGLAINFGDGGGAQDFALTGISSGDIDLDGDEDLLLGNSTKHKGIILENINSGSGPAFDPLTFVMLLPLDPSNPGGSAGGNDCPPSMADYDGDGYADCVFARDDSSQLVPHRGVAVFNGGGAALDVLSTEDLLHTAMDFEDPSPAAPAGTMAQLHLLMTIPDDIRAIHTHMDLTVWEMDDPSTLAVDEDAVLNDRYALAAGFLNAPVNQYVPVVGANSFPLTASITWTEGKHYFVFFRFRRIVSGLLEAESSGFLFGLRMDTTSHPVLLSELSGGGSVIDLREGNGPGGGGPGRIKIGSIVPQQISPPPIVGMQSMGPQSSGPAMTIW